jgi:2,4-dienoyl-CoA reductase-like NADH-dependent reductase (Old Yellow Enzyme family)
MMLRNRIVMAPMTRKLSPDGVPGLEVVSYYARRAANDVGLIITEGTVINHPAACDHCDVPRLYGPAVAGWAKVVGAVHAEGASIVAQLWHMGTARRVNSGPNPEAPSVGPSGLDAYGRAAGTAMTEADVAAAVDAFADAAATAERVGFDGVELHAAHGYLIDQFLWDRTNRRNDRFGGDVLRRTQFAVDIVAACRARVSSQFPILLRFSQWKLQDYAARLANTVPDLRELLAPLVAAGVDAFDCSTRRFWKPEFDGSDLTLAAWTRRLTGLPTIAVGGVGHGGDFLVAPFDDRPTGDSTAIAARFVARQWADLVAVGRAILADPEWVTKVRDGRGHAVRSFTPEALRTLA